MYPMKSPRVGVLLGHTASGKTAISLRLARRLDAEIVSADSMLVYRYMDIGTAKPTLAQRQQVPHHVIDMVDPDEAYDAARYRRDALGAARDIMRRGKRVLVVGGTGLYIRALIMGLFPGPGADPPLRKQLEEWENPLLYQRLREVDPDGAARLHPNDRVRIIRALEVYTLTGLPISHLQRSHGFAKPFFSVLRMGLQMEPQMLITRIRMRVQGMFLKGLMEEVKGLMARGYGPRLRPMQAFAYRHAYDVLAGRIPQEEAIRRIIRDTWRLARRQITWFRKEPDIIWLPFTEEDEMASLLEEFWDSKSTGSFSRAISAP
jgi:tRNA dimethylallyltransferase